MSSFTTSPLADCLKLVIDYRGKTPKKLGGDWSTRGYRALSANNVKTSGLDSFETIRYVDEPLYRKWMKKEVEKGDLLLTSEAPAGQIMYWDSEERIVLSQRLFALRTNGKVYPKYLKYYLQSEIGQKEIFNKLSGSTVSGISAKMFDFINVRYPDYDMQKKIGDFLYSLDAKIQLNLEMNAQLEAAASDLYDYWFVQFDFPNAQGKPYKSSKGEIMTWKKPAYHIPSGWSVSNILSVANLFGGGTPSKSNSQYWNGDIPFFTPADGGKNTYCVATEDYITNKGVENSSTKLFDIGTVFITARGSVGKIAIAGKQMGMNQSCYAFVPKDNLGSAFVYFSAKQMVQYLKVKSSGSVFNSIVTNDIKYTPLIIPPESLIRQYDEIVAPFFASILKNTQEIKRLSELRDWLIPMFITGQVKVKEGSLTGLQS